MSEDKPRYKFPGHTRLSLETGFERTAKAFVLVPLVVGGGYVGWKQGGSLELNKALKLRAKQFEPIDEQIAQTQPHTINGIRFEVKPADQKKMQDMQVALKLVRTNLERKPLEIDSFGVNANLVSGCIVGAALGLIALEVLERSIERGSEFLANKYAGFVESIKNRNQPKQQELAP